MFSQQSDYYPRNEDQTSSAEKELQEQKLHDTVAMLVSAGYFRARSPRLSSFDKVVGGMCWCITHSLQSNLDVDVVFRSSATTGQNIKLAEEIVHTMRAMGCPVALQAHQIHGHDWAQVQPAIAWLIKTMFEARQSHGSRLRLFSEQQFDKSFAGLTTKKESRNVPRKGPERKFRYAGSTSGLSEESAVFSTLLEFGDRLDVKLRMTKRGGGEDRDLDRAMKQAEKESEAAKKKEEAAAVALQSDMEQTTRQQQQIAGASVGRIVRLGADEIATAAERYREATAETRAAYAGDALVAVLEQRAEKARGRVAAAKEHGQELVATIEEAKKRISASQMEKKKTTDANDRVSREIAKLVEFEKTCDKKQDLNELKRLVASNETTKRKEAEFKASCKQKLVSLQAELEAAKAAADDSDKLAEIESMHAKVMAKDARLRRQVAASSRKIATTARLIDDVPTRTELVQYERRFQELYAQVATKLDETKKYYQLYNSLDEIWKTHQKEVTILNSIIDTFAEAMKTKQSKQTFLSQLDEINAGLRKSLATKRENYKVASERERQEQAKHQSLVEEHRNYHAAVKELHEECQRNELLQAKLQQAKKMPRPQQKHQQQQQHRQTSIGPL